MASMASEVITEYLRACQFCLEGDEVLGYPATLLLLCVINAFGSYLKGESVRIDGKLREIKRGEPFRVLNHPLFGLQLKEKQIKLVEYSYRNGLSHNAIIERGAFLLPGQAGAPFIFNGNVVLIRVGAFYSLVSRVWSQFPKETIVQWEQRRPGYLWSSSEVFELSKSNKLLPDELQALMRDYQQWKKKKKKKKKKKAH